MKTTLLTICLEKKVFISSKSNHRPIVMSISLLIRHMFDQQGFFFPYPKSEFPIKQKNKRITISNDTLIFI